MSTFRVMAFAYLVTVTSYLIADDQVAPSADQLGKTVKRALPFVIEKGEWWIEKKKCVSCHRVAMTTWSLSAAKQKGLEVDDQKLTELTEWSLDHQLGKNDKGKVIGSGNLDGLAQLILSRDLEATKDKAASFNQFVDLITAGQKDDGTWKPGGQLPSQKRKLLETTAVGTMWLTLSLQHSLSVSAKSKPESTTAINKAADKALSWIRKSKAGVSTEWLVTRLLIESRANNPKQVEELLAQLRSQQHEDGGWGWQHDHASDAFATGQVLYALSKLSVSKKDTAVARGLMFLTSTQNDDGSWTVPGTKKVRKNKPAETSTYWGTCWAVIGLCEWLP